jgi:hypothetical protein
LAVDWLNLDALREHAEQADPRLAAAAVGAARTAAAAGLALVRESLLADEPDARHMLAADPMTRRHCGR